MGVTIREGKIVCTGDIEPAGNIVLAATKTVDGRDLSELISGNERLEESIEGWVLHTNVAAAEATIGTLPANIWIDDVLVEVTVAFDDTGTDFLGAGWGATFNELINHDCAVGTTGIKSPTVLIKGYSATSRVVKARYTGQNGNAATGKALVVVKFRRVTVSP